MSRKYQVIALAEGCQRSDPVGGEAKRECRIEWLNLEFSLHIRSREAVGVTSGLSEAEDSESLLNYC